MVERSASARSSGDLSNRGELKHERIEKELLLLRNLPNNSFKLGQKKTNLGRVIYVSESYRD
jgi:hypothetical protein